MSYYEILEPVQVEKANQLALAFGHYWGGVSLNKKAELTPQAIEAAVLCQFNEPTMASITYPEVDDKGNIIHTTGTGRLEWSIFPSGIVQLKVNRPEQDGLLTAIVRESEVEVSWNEGDSLEKLLFPRHVWAMDEAVKALQPSLELHPSLAPALALAKTNAGQITEEKVRDLLVEVFREQEWHSKEEVVEALLQCDEESRVEGCAKVLRLR